MILSPSMTKPEATPKRKGRPDPTRGWPPKTKKPADIAVCGLCFFGCVAACHQANRSTESFSGSAILPEVSAIVNSSRTSDALMRRLGATGEHQRIKWTFAHLI